MGIFSREKMDEPSDKSWSHVKILLDNRSKPRVSNWADGLPDSLFDVLFTYLNGTDLKSCRLVCKTWESFSAPMMFEKTHLTFRGSDSPLILRLFKRLLGRKSRDKKFTRLIKKNPTFANSWPQLNIQDADNRDFKTLLHSLTPEIRSLAFVHMTSLELFRCTLAWSKYFTLISTLRNLQSLFDIETTFILDSPMRLCIKSFPDIQEELVQKYGQCQLSFTKLKIVRKEMGTDMLIYLKLLESCQVTLEQLEFEVEDIGLPLGNEHMDLGTPLGLICLKQGETLKDLNVTWLGEFGFHFLEDFYRALRITMWLHPPLLITELYLHFDFIFVGNPGFQEVLVPFIQRLEHLKTFSIKKIILQPEWVPMLSSVQPDNFESLDTKISLGILLSDHPDQIVAEQNLEQIRGNETLQRRISSIRVAISSPNTEELQNIVPLNLNHSLPEVTELFVNHLDFSISCDFHTYNVDLICHAFRNLTILSITDGSRFSYFGRFRIQKQYDLMTQAVIGDCELQCIFRHLKRLQRIRFRARMSTLTDSGMTGLTSEVCQEMRDSGNYNVLAPMPLVSRTCPQGLSFSALKDLEEIVLKGLAQEVTDVSAFHAFKNLRNLKVLGLFGDTRISKVGRRHLINLFPEAKGHYVIII